MLRDIQARVYKEWIDSDLEIEEEKRNFWVKSRNSVSQTILVDYGIAAAITSTPSYII